MTPQWDTLTLPHALAVAAGAALGGLARWIVGLWLSGQGPGFPMGTLAVNLVGGLLIGVAIGVFSRHPNEALRLLLVTGFLGGFTTFSAFSAESLSLLQREEWMLAAGHAAVHVFGALCCAAVGLRLTQVWTT